MGITVGVGIAVREMLSVIAPGGEGPQFITLQRVWERCDGGALRAIRAHTGDEAHPVVTSENPLASGKSGDNGKWHDDEIEVAACLKSLYDAVRTNGEPTYGPAQGRIDQAIVPAIRKSSEEGSGRHRGGIERPPQSAGMFRIRAGE